MSARCQLLTLIVLGLLVQTVAADEIHAKNRKAKRLYVQGKYEAALEVYDDALLTAPDEPALQANRGAVLYQAQRYDEAAESFDQALDAEQKEVAAAVHYNRGNTYYRQGEQLMSAGNQQAMEKFKAALQEYTKTLALRPKDRDAKWNLQLAYQRVKQMESMPQQQNNDQNQQDQNQDQDQQQNQQKNQNKDQQQDQQQNQNKDPRQDQQRDQNEERQDQQKDQNKDPRQDQQQDRPPRPQPRPDKEDMEKEQAARLLRQFADDDKNLNKPEKTAIAPGGQPEKDW